MEPIKLAKLYLEAYFVMSGTRIETLEEIPENVFLFFADMAPDYLAHPVILHYRCRGWAHRRIAQHVGVTIAKVKVLLKQHGL